MSQQTKMSQTNSIENNMITERQKNYIIWKIKDIKNGKIGDPDLEELANSLFPDEFIGGVNQVYLQASEKLMGLDTVDAGVVIELFDKGKEEEGFNQLISLL